LSDFSIDFEKEQQKILYSQQMKIDREKLYDRIEERNKLIDKSDKSDLNKSFNKSVTLHSNLKDKMNKIKVDLDKSFEYAPKMKTTKLFED
jgi:hypothetical protein